MNNTHAKKPKILHVDDSADILMIVKTILEKEGFEVTGVSSGAKALEKLAANNYALMIFDTMMPDMTGWELYNRIRKTHPDDRVVFLSILEMPEKEIKGLKDAGIMDYIRKPFDRNDFVKRIKKCLD